MDAGALLAATKAVVTSSSMGHPAFCSKHEALSVLSSLSENPTEGLEAQAVSP